MKPFAMTAFAITVFAMTEVGWMVVRWGFPRRQALAWVGERWACLKAQAWP